MNGFGISALLIRRLRPAPLLAGPVGVPLLRLGLMLSAQLAFFLAVTLASR